MQDRVWEELGRIDYFLDQLARAVERGEVPAESYERLAPRYLERREELTRIIDLRAQKRAVAPVQQESSVARRLPDDDLPAEVLFPTVTRRGLDPYGRPASASQRPSAPRPVAPPREPVAVSTMLAYVGALLVVVAVAIFTVYNWQTFSPMVKLASLLGVTAVFYAAGEGVRVGLKLPVIGVALLGVGSAMLLFDGWLLITAFHLSGPMPWALVLLACSLAYWATELRVEGKWFGAMGAGAQIAWWWLLGRGLGWSLEPILVALACVALAWVVLGARTPREGSLATLGLTLRWAGPGLAVFSAAAVVYATAAMDSTWSYTQVAQALAVVVVAALAIELSEVPFAGLSVIALAPAIPAIARLRFELAASWPFAAAALGVLVLACAAYALWRGRGPYAVAAVAASVAALALGTPSGGRLELFIASLACIGLAWLGVARTLRGRGGVAMTESASVWEFGGAAVLALATMLVPLATVRLIAGNLVEPEPAALSVGIVFAWAIASVLSRGRGLGWAVYATSFYALAVVLRWATPDLGAAWFALALLSLAVAWSQADPLPRRALEIQQPFLGLVTAALLVLIPAGGLVTEIASHVLTTWPAAALAAAASLAWLAEGVRRDRPFAFPVAALFAVGAGGLAGSAGAYDPWAPLAAAVVALAIAGVGSLDRGQDTRGGTSAAVGALVASLFVPAAFGYSLELGSALVTLVLVWAGVAYACRLPEFAFLAALAASGAVATALDAASAPPLATIVCFAVAGAASLLPAVLVRGVAGSPSARLARTLAFSGAVALMVLAGLGWTSWAAAETGRWWTIGWQGLAAALVLLGGHVIVWSGLEDVEVGLYAGFGAFLLAYWVLLSGSDVRQAELYLVVGAVYSAAMGYLWASRGSDREVPPITDIAAVTLGVVWPFLLSFAAWDAVGSYNHGVIALALATAAVAAGLVLRVRAYFLTGLVVAALDSLWLSREFIFALPKWLLIGTVGVALIGLGLAYARRQEAMGDAAGRMRAALADWR